MALAGTEEHHQQMLEVEEGWAVIQHGIHKLIQLIEGVETQSFSSQDYMNYYTAVYTMCKPNPTGGICEVLYDKYNNVFKDYINSHVLPSLQGKKDEALVKETEKRWSNHKVMTRWLFRFFHYLDRYFVPKRKVPPLQESALLCFYNLVFGEFNNQIRDAVLSLAPNWIKNESYNDYMLKVECCLKHERETVSCYLRNTSQKKLLEIVEYETKLKEKKQVDESPGG
ncbi:cullin 1, AUXIN RESISTANT 6, INCURVATA 13 [Hibiscus trionum]|uniref:Cullin 1, AUXIN RESISTANT 6, INCURVATA 13 n=1 Tax=Hibiscus trionum TaxID=183268 RepID=A0A9W7GUA9_HIBTR|nr:cullin 1, AUXIN RESISTANT 6, INCURVATA 13 [Hibiscus trionum]